MPQFRSIHCDVFAPRIGSGNPLAVVLNAESLSSEQMQSIANWMNLAETTFVIPASEPEADYQVRIFTTQKEIAFAGHPSIGTAHALLESGLKPKQSGIYVQQCKAGLLPIRLPNSHRSILSVCVPSSHLIRYANESDSHFSQIFTHSSIASVKPALVEGGRRWWLAELPDEHSVRAFTPDTHIIKQLADESQSLGLCIFARRKNAETDLVVRAFPLGVGIVEDPASGAANAAIAAFLLETNALAELGNSYTVSQGREMSRDAVLHLEIDSQQRVWVGGNCHTVIRGELYT